jgi:pimeloyl-ACP methyl ester carboxylesterase
VEIVCIHGAGGSSADWGPQVETLAGVRALNLPGHGGDPGPGRDSLASYADWLAERLNGSKPLILAGHSMGGAIVLSLALRHPRPDWLAALILVSTGAQLGVHPKFFFFAEHDFAGIVDLVAGWPASTDAARRTREVLQRDMELAGREVVRDDYRAVDHFDVRPHISRIDLPALVMVGADDRATPPQKSRDLCAALPDCELAIIERAAHLPMLQRPEDVSDAMQLFRARIEQALTHS